LQPKESARVLILVQKQYQLETRALASPEARGAMVPTSTLEFAMQEIRGRYQSEAEYLEDIECNGLDETAFATALEREMKVEAILEKVGARAEKVSDTDVELYYLYHPEQFRRAETRLARHILITINDTIAENTRAAAQKRIEDIASRLAKEPQRFEEQALKHSECPTALEGGRLGDLPRGKLFPELDAALFELNAGEVSGVLESAMGFHVLRCDTISEVCVLDFSEAKQLIRKLMEQKRKRTYQKMWIKKLLEDKPNIK
jgi:nitrogen fixation protein NifM